MEVPMRRKARFDRRPKGVLARREANDLALPATLQPAGERSLQSGSIADGSPSDPAADFLTRKSGEARR
jgi:hypothetical protein